MKLSDYLTQISLRIPCEWLELPVENSVVLDLGYDRGQTVSRLMKSENFKQSLRLFQVRPFRSREWNNDLSAQHICSSHFQLPFSTGSFNLLTAINLQFLFGTDFEELKLALLEAVRVLAPKGYLIIDSRSEPLLKIISSGLRNHLGLNSNPEEISGTGEIGQFLNSRGMELSGLVSLSDDRGQQFTVQRWLKGKFCGL